MDKIQILQQIVDKNGNCDWSKTEICTKCPLGQLKVKSDGSFYSCIESVGVEGLTSKQADEKYKAAAEKALLDIHMDETLGD